MIDHDGEEWLQIADVAERLGVEQPTVRQWISRQKVRAQRIGRNPWVNMTDAADAEHRSRQLRKTRALTRGSSTP